LAVGDPSKVISPDDPGRGDRRRDAIAVVNGFLQAYEGYHTREEEMTWLVTALYLGGAVLLVGGKPFWQSWPGHWFGAWMVLLACTGIAAVWFVWWQFTQRHRATAFLEACHATLAHWLHTGVAPGDLHPTPLRDMSCIMVPVRLHRELPLPGHAQHAAGVDPSPDGPLDRCRWHFRDAHLQGTVGKHGEAHSSLCMAALDGY
jgi:hypothetical protein